MDINGTIFPTVLAAVSMSGRMDDTAITEALTKFNETPVVVKMRR